MTLAARAFDPHEARDPHGRWADRPGGSVPPMHVGGLDALLADIRKEAGVRPASSPDAARLAKYRFSGPLAAKITRLEGSEGGIRRISRALRAIPEDMQQAMLISRIEVIPDLHDEPANFAEIFNDTLGDYDTKSHLLRISTREDADKVAVHEAMHAWLEGTGRAGPRSLEWMGLAGQVKQQAAMSPEFDPEGQSAEVAGEELYAELAAQFLLGRQLNADQYGQRGNPENGFLPRALAGRVKALFRQQGIRPVAAGERQGSDGHVRGGPGTGRQDHLRPAGRRGQAGPAAGGQRRQVTLAARAYDPREKRDSGGKWTGGPGGGAAGKAAGRLPWSVSGDVTTYHGSLGIDRADMPQLSGTIDGEYVPSKAIMPRFIAHMRSRGVKVTEKRISPASLRPTQTTGDTPVIREIADDLKSGKLADSKPISVSADGRVLDGHHTWAARVLAAAEGGRKGLPPDMRVVQFGLPMNDLIAAAREFGKTAGIAPRRPGEFANPAFAAAHRTGWWDPDERLSRLTWGPGDERLHPRLPSGKHGGGEWTKALPAAAPSLKSSEPGISISDTLVMHTRPDGSLDPARKMLHDKIVSSILSGHHPQQHPVATFLGGGTASGKSSMPESKVTDEVHVDADAIKGMLPEYQQRLRASDPSAAAYVHNESSDVAKRVQQEAVDKHYNFLLDGTGNSSPEKMRGKVEAARAAGYKVAAKYVTVDTETAIERAKARAAKTGRMVPESVIRENHAAVSVTFAALVREGAFDDAELWDTNGPERKLVGQVRNGKWTVTDQAAWKRFLAKGGL